jgi:uncharacterized membrane protein YbhN (UPF0104 family)
MSVFCGGIGLALYLLSHGMADFSVSLFVSQLRNVSLLRLGMLGLPFAVGLWVKWLRWHLCIQHVDHAVLGRTVFRAQLWGYCASNILPFKAGEAVKLAVLKKKGHRVLPLLPTIALDRFWDGAVLLLLLLLALPFFSEAAWMREMAVVAAVLFVGGLVCFCVFIFFLSETFFVRLGDRMKGLLQGFLALRSVRLWSALACLSLINWLAEAWCFAVVFWAFGVSVPLAACMVAVAAVNFAGLAIAVPASIGVFEFCVVAVLIAVGVSQKTAFGMALVLHGLMVVPLFVVAGGVLLMDRFGKRRRVCRG